MKKVILIILLLVLLWIQSLLFPFGIKPLLFLVLLAMSLSLGDLQENLILAVTVGLILDFSSSLPDGIFTFSLILSVFLIRPLLEVWIKRQKNILMLLTTTALTTVSFFILVYFCNWVFGFWNASVIFNVRQELGHFLQALIFNLLCGYPVFWVYTRIRHVRNQPV